MFHFSYIHFYVAISPSRFNFCVAPSVQCSVPVAQYKKITLPFGNSYLYTLIQLKRFSLCPFHFIHIYSDHVKRKPRRHNGFPFGSICPPKRLIILCVHGTRRIFCSNIIRGCQFLAKQCFCFCSMLYEKIFELGDRRSRKCKCLASYWIGRVCYLFKYIYDHTVGSRYI